MIKKILHNIPALIIAVLMLWIALSWVDIIIDNTTVDPVHSKYNLIIMLNEYSREARQ